MYLGFSVPFVATVSSEGADLVLSFDLVLQCFTGSPAGLAAFVLNLL